MAQQLGKAFGIMMRAQAAEIFMHADISAFGAPSECHDVVSKGEANRARMARRHAKAVSGLSRRAFNRALAGFPQPAWDRASHRVYAAKYPF